MSKSIEARVQGDVVELDPCLLNGSFLMTSQISRLSIIDTYIKIKTIDRVEPIWIKFRDSKSAEKAFLAFGKYIRDET